jgi:hypothetical protein
MTAINWTINGPEDIKRLGRIVRRKVRENRSMVITNYALSTEQISDIADAAGCDWLFKESEGEVGFFEFN